MKDHIKFINYKKPKPFQIKDKESANLKKIKNCLYPPSIEELTNIQNEKDNDNDNDDSDNISIQSKIIFKVNKKNRNKKNLLIRNSSMSSIKSNLNINNIINQQEKSNKDIIDEIDNIDVTGKDTLEVLNNLVNQGKYLPERMEKKLEKINSLIDVDLPYPTSYELLLSYFKNLENSNNQKYFSFYPFSNKTTKFNNLKNCNKTLPEITPDMRKKLTFIKDDIKNLKNISLNKKGIFDYMFKDYFGAKTVNNKNRINLEKNNEKNKKLNHKNSMDNIFEKKGNTVFVTLKHVLEKEKNDNIKRKIRSCNSVQMKK